ncbi:hypothetical protein P22_3489 [Propionispora sp. 2/2-37]|uniref:DeoR/GlpR family DNA-binding transcription regulator n=1 Tax=Propionispora sp. 2/2-37 TaxID=1677858 RepID=UPI0006C4A781|nr:DeoR/GlpR family DNA-binding transcription regulator [Propionispora sp. 2/2-37]CUH97361.1 hypothetical protein P22_3489 [Propionispora sp. 2/2-37]
MSLFAQERQEEILKLLQRDGKVVVKELSHYFNVTEDCIRKDLTVLENESLLQKTYGGAIPVRVKAYNAAIAERLHSNQEAKTLIANKAFKEIQEQDTVFLDISTTNLILAEQLSRSNKRVTVITNMIDIVAVLNRPDNQIDVICTGGGLSKFSNGFIGAMTISSILNYKPHKAFIGSCGVDITDNSVTTVDLDDANTKRAIIKNSQKIYLVMENNKFYHDAPYKFSSLQHIDAVITNTFPDKEIVSVLQKNNTQVI